MISPIVAYTLSESGLWVTLSNSVLVIDTDQPTTWPIKVDGKEVWAIKTSSGHVADCKNGWRHWKHISILPEKKGLKHDYGKPRMDLISPIALTYLAHVLSFGATKYASHNWRNGIPQDKIIAACLRHLMAMLGGEVHDRETGLPHAAHLMCEAMFICELQCSENNTPVSYQYSETQKNLLASLLASMPETARETQSSIHP